LGDAARWSIKRARGSTLAVLMRATGSVGIVVLIMLAAVLSACGDERHDASASAASATAAATTATQPRSAAPAQLGDRALARSALVRLDDFPGGWGLANVPPPDVRCGTTNPYRGARVVTSSKRIVQDQLGVQETVVLFDRADASGRAFARMNAPAAMRCLRQSVRRELSKEAGAQASPLEVARVDRPGRWERATRFSATAPSSIGEIRGSIDAVHLRVGRGLGALVIVSGIGPVEESLYDRVTRLFARRLDGVLD
jgi:hypothetical protein